MMHSRQNKSPFEGQATGSRDRARQSLHASKARKEAESSLPLRVP